MAKYLVTGGAGFIGSHLVDALINKGHNVVIIDDFSVGHHHSIHAQATYINESILNIKQIQPFFDDIDGCFHLAAIPSVMVTMDSWFKDHDINLQGSLNVFKSAVLAGGVPVVYASSCAVYGDSQRFPLKENTYTRTISAYASDKLAIENNAYFLSKTYGLPTFGLRFFNVYGPRQNPLSPYSGVICKFISRLLKNESPVIFGDGAQTRDFIFVKDVSEGLILAMQLVNTEAHLVNMCTGRAISVQKLYENLRDLIGNGAKAKYEERRLVDVLHSVGCTNKMHSMGFTTRYDLLEGLKSTVEFERAR